MEYITSWEVLLCSEKNKTKLSTLEDLHSNSSIATLDKLSVSNADSASGTVGEVTIHKNRVIDLANFENITRFDLLELSGIVEKRANTYVLVK